MKQLELTFKSGATLTVDAVDVSSRKVGDELVELGWTTPAAPKRKLHALINLSEIVAVVVIN